MRWFLRAGQILVSWPFSGIWRLEAKCVWRWTCWHHEALRSRLSTLTCAVQTGGNDVHADMYSRFSPMKGFTFILWTPAH